VNKFALNAAARQVVTAAAKRTNARAYRTRQSLVLVPAAYMRLQQAGVIVKRLRDEVNER